MVFGAQRFAFLPAGMRKWSAAGFSVVCLCGLESDQVCEGRNLAEVLDAILKILPKRLAQLAAGRLQAEKGVARTTTCVAPRARADLPLLHVLPDVVLRQIVVQRNLRAGQDQQQLITFAVNLLQRQVQSWPAGLLSEQPVEVLFQTASHLRSR